MTDFVRMIAQALLLDQSYWQGTGQATLLYRVSAIGFGALGEYNASGARPTFEQFRGQGPMVHIDLQPLSAEWDDSLLPQLELGGWLAANPSAAFPAFELAIQQLELTRGDGTPAKPVIVVLTDAGAFDVGGKTQTYSGCTGSPLHSQWKEMFERSALTQMPEVYWVVFIDSGNRGDKGSTESRWIPLEQEFATVGTVAHVSVIDIAAPDTFLTDMYRVMVELIGDQYALFPGDADVEFRGSSFVDLSGGKTETLGTGIGVTEILLTILVPGGFNGEISVSPVRDVNHVIVGNADQQIYELRVQPLTQELELSYSEGTEPLHALVLVAVRPADVSLEIDRCSRLERQLGIQVGIGQAVLNDFQIKGVRVWACPPGYKDPAAEPDCKLGTLSLDPTGSYYIGDMELDEPQQDVAKQYVLSVDIDVVSTDGAGGPRRIIPDRAVPLEVRPQPRVTGIRVLPANRADDANIVPRVGDAFVLEVETTNPNSYAGKLPQEIQAQMIWAQDNEANGCRISKRSGRVSSIILARPDRIPQDAPVVYQSLGASTQWQVDGAHNFCVRLDGQTTTGEGFSTCFAIHVSAEGQIEPSFNDCSQFGIYDLPPQPSLPPHTIVGGSSAVACIIIVIAVVRFHKSLRDRDNQILFIVLALKAVYLCLANIFISQDVPHPYGSIGLLLQWGVLVNILTLILYWVSRSRQRYLPLFADSVASLFPVLDLFNIPPGQLIWAFIGRVLQAYVVPSTPQPYPWIWLISYVAISILWVVSIVFRVRTPADAIAAGEYVAGCLRAALDGRQSTNWIVGIIRNHRRVRGQNLSNIMNGLRDHPNQKTLQEIRQRCEDEGWL